MSLILHIETASPVCSAAVSRNGILLGVRESDADKSHTTRLTVFIQELFDELGIKPQELDAISLSMGPGSYTGLRIGTSVAKGLAFGLGIPVIGLPTLKLLAAGFRKTHPETQAMGDSAGNTLLCPMLDARRMEVYTAIYNIDLQENSPVEALILDERSFSGLLEDRTIWFFGTGSQKASGIILHPNARFQPDLALSARWQTHLAAEAFQRNEFLDTAYFEPHYLKEFIASIPKNKVLG